MFLKNFIKEFFLRIILFAGKVFRDVFMESFKCIPTKKIWRE